MNNKIRFLIKFLKEKQYADDLCDGGELFMRSADDFIRIERETNSSGRGDIREGLVLNFARIGMNFPIYCMYSCFENEIFDNKILINKKVVSDFFDNNGYLVVIDYDQFVEKLVYKNFEGFRISYGEVSYGVPTDEYNKEIFKDMKVNALFIKDPTFKYQNEFRILVYKNLKLIDDKENIEKNIGTKYSELPFKKYDTHTFKLGDLSEFAKVIEVAKLQEYNDTHIALPMKEIIK